TPPSTPARPASGSTGGTRAARCGSRSPATVAAAPGWRTARSCAGSSAGTLHSTRTHPSAPRRAAWRSRPEISSVRSHRPRPRPQLPAGRPDDRDPGAAVRVVIGEDLALLMEGLVSLLEPHDFEIAAAVDSGPALLEAMLDHRPDVAVVDVRLPPSFTDEGLQAALEARRRVPGLPVLVLSQYVEQLYARELLADGSGGIGYLLKDRVFDAAQFVDAVRRVAAGGTAMDPEVISRLVATGTRGTPLSRLTPRELEVLELMAQGRSNAAIAERLVITERAVT